jgi:hypothetical protein
MPAAPWCLRASFSVLFTTQLQQLLDAASERKKYLKI